MKKTISWLLLIVMMLGIFAGCGNTEQTPTDAPTAAAGDLEGINAAIDYLKAFYKDEGNETFADFERFGVVRIAGVAYTVVWTADVAEDQVKAVVNEDGTVTIDINESNETETPYALTATITDDAGNTASHSWNYILPVGLGNDYGAIVDMAYELEKDQAFDYDSTLVGTVTAINTAWSDEYKNISVTIVVEGREDKPILCYRLKGDGAQDLAPGDLITVTGKLKNYNGTIEFDAGCTLDKVEKGAGTLSDVPTDPLEIVDAAYALEVGASLPYSATLTGEVVSIDDPFSTQYNNITVSIKVEGREDKPIKCYRLKGEGADQIMPGDTITVSGMIKNYNGTIEFDAGCSLVELVKGENSFVMPTDPKEIVNMAYELGVGEALPVQVTLTGLINVVDTPYSDRYNNITVWMVVEGMHDKPIQCFRMKGADVDKIWTWDTITVTGTLKNYNGTIEFDAGCKLDSWVDTGMNPDYPTTQKEIVDALYALGQGEAFPGIYSLTGRVVSAEDYALNYGNQTITIDVEGKQVICYRMTTGGIEIQAGDYVTVRGNLEDYKGKKQLTSGYLTWYDETTLAEAVAEVKTIKHNTKLFYEESITGTVKINTAFSSSYNNITFTVTNDEGIAIKCYRVSFYGADKLKNGDVVTVTGKLLNYNGQPQFDSTATVYCERLAPTVAKIADGTYVIVAGNQALTALSTSKTYGYMNGTAVTFADGTLTGYDEDNIFTITNTANGFTITDCHGRLVYLSGTYNSFNVGKASAGHEWVAYDLGNGTYNIVNVQKGKTMGYDTSYKSYGAYVPAKGVNALAVYPVAKPEPTPQPNPDEVKTLAEQIAAVQAMKNGDYLTVVTSTIEGKIVEIKEAYTTQYKNISFVVENEDGIKLTCWRLTKNGVDALKVGDEVSVSGNLLNYNGTAQFDKTATVTLIKAGEVTPEPEEPADPSEPETPSETKTATFTFNFSTSDTKDISAADLKNAFSSNGLSAESASGISKIFKGNPQSGQFQGANFIKTGSSSAAGTMTLTFPSNVKISKVTVNCHGWNTSSNNTISINGSGAQTASKSGSPADLVFNLDNPTNVLSFNCNKRVFIFSVTVEYTEG